MAVVQAKAVVSLHLPNAHVPASLLPAGAPPLKRRRHRYIDLACDGCRARKKRCDRPQQSPDGTSAPSCSQCLQASLPCIVSSKARSSKRQQCQQTRQARTTCPILIAQQQLQLQQQLQHRQQHQHEHTTPKAQTIAPLPLSAQVPRLTSSSSNSDDDDYNGPASPPSPQSPPHLHATTSSQSFASATTAGSSASSSITSPLLQPQSPTGDASEAGLDMPCLISSISAMSFPYSDEPRDNHATSHAILSTSFAYDAMTPLPVTQMMSPLLMFNMHGGGGGEETSTSTTMVHSWASCVTSSSSAPSSSFSSSPYILPLPVAPVATSRSTSSASSTSTAHSSGASSLTDSGVVPVFSLQHSSSLYIDTYLSLVNGGLYKYLDDAAFRSSYFEHHIAHSAPSPPGSAWLLCVSAVMAVGARMHGSVRYAEECAVVARHCARSIRANPPAAMEDCALAYRALLVLSYYSAAVLCRAEVEGLTVAESLLTIDGARSLIPASIIHLHHLQPSFADVLDPPSDAVCDAVVKQQMDMYGADKAKYLKCKRLLRAQSSVAEEDDELLDGEALDEQVDISADLASSSKRCQPESIEQLNCSLYLALSTVHRRPSLCFSVYDCLITLLCAEAAVLAPPQRCTVYGMKLACYLLLGKRTQAVHAARDLIQLVVGMRQANTTCLAPFALAFVRSTAILSMWDETYGAPCLIPSALCVLHAVAPLWPALHHVEAQLLQRLRDTSRLQMQDATASMADINSRQQRGTFEPATHHSLYQLSAARLQRAMNKEMAIQALTSEWDNLQLLAH